MRTPTRTLLAIGTAALAAIAGTTTVAGAADASANPLTLAVIGDVPYGVPQEESFDTLIDAINRDPKVDTALHVGDVKSGSTTCSDERLAAIAEAFASFEDPVVYTPGDNEWTDCHRPNNGSYDPLERLAEVRRLFFAEPGSTLGARPMEVVAQRGYPENVRWSAAGVVFASLHVVGSDNGLVPWTGNPQPTDDQRDEVDARIAAVLAWIDATFDEADAAGRPGVVLAMQADTWDPAPTPGQEEIVERIAARTAAFEGEVLLLQGDSHEHVADNPFELDNFTRIVVHGETLPFEYLRLTIDPKGDALFSWDRVAVPGETDPGDSGRDDRGRGRGTLVIGHRGASGYRPEHTLAAYELAIQQCADYIEPDLVMTRDGVPVARHENEIGGTTDVEDHPEFAARMTTKTIDGQPVTGWFTEDFTLAELKTLRAEERIPLTRPQNTAYDRQFDVPTLQEVIDLAQRSRTCDGKPVGLYPETKHPTYFDALDLSMEEPLVELLEANGYRGPGAPVFIQSFEVTNLMDLDRRTDLRLVQLVNCTGQPYDFTAAGNRRSYADMVTPAGLTEIGAYADGLGACKTVLIPRNANGTLGEPTAVIDDAHDVGLVVHGWTFRAENQFLPTEHRVGSDPNALGDMAGEVRRYIEAGMDGFFTDHPDRGPAAS